MYGVFAFEVLGLVSAAAFEGPGSSIPGIVHFPVDRLKSELLVRRDSDTDTIMEEKLFNSRTFYAINCSLGTPAQELRLVLDTGSSDLWVMDADIEEEIGVCSPQHCSKSSLFSKLNSSTFQSNNTRFYIQFADGTSADGSWAQDILSVGGASIKNFSFALSNYSSTTHGVAGIGLPKGETPFLLGTIDSPYANLPIQLKSSGLIAHMAYSLYLDSYSDATGSILFGGINEGAYQGELYRFPLVPVDTGEIDRLAIKMQSLWVMNDKGEQQKFADTSYPVVFDSGSTLSLLPEPLLLPLMQAMNAQYERQGDVGIAYDECGRLKNNHGGFGFTFGGIEFVVNFRDLILEGDRDQCLIGFEANDIALFGDNILRSLYVVYDLENKEIAIAQANTNSTIETSYKTIGNTIPGKKAPGYNDTLLEYDYTIHEITVFTKFHLFTPSSTQDSLTDSSVTLTPTSAPVEVTIGGTASKDGIAPTYAGDNDIDSGENSASNNRVPELFTVLFCCLGIFLALL